MAKYPTTSIFHDKYHPKNDGKCAVSLRITFNGKKKYYPTKYKLTPEEFGELSKFKLNSSQKMINAVLSDQENKAIQIIDELKDRFTWSLFEQRFNRKTGESQNLIALLEERGGMLRKEERISTAVLFECTSRSLQKFLSKKRLTLDEVSPTFLKKYKAWMLTESNSITTIGMYLRNVRTIFNEAISAGDLPKELYPFGKAFNKFTIPTGRNIKKALSLADIAAIYNYNSNNETELRAKDFWLFSYLCNGINVKDIAQLKMKNINQDVVSFERAKTKRANEDNPVIISFPITEDIRRIMNKWGRLSLNKEAYIFPILSIGNAAEEIYNKIQLFTKYVNSHMRNICQKLNIDAKCTTYVARHSFSTILKNSGASVEAISEALGHSNIKTTQSYLAGFEDDAKRKMASLLTNFEKLKAI